MLVTCVSYLACSCFNTDITWPITCSASPSHLSLSCLCMAIAIACFILVVLPCCDIMLPYPIACVADPSRSLNPKLILCFHLPYLNSTLPVIYFLLTHVYRTTPYMWSLDPLTCYHLVRPSSYVMIDPAHYTFTIMFYCLLYITILSYYPLNQAWYTWLMIILFTGTLPCLMELSATPSNGGGHL